MISNVQDWFGKDFRESTLHQTYVHLPAVARECVTEIFTWRDLNDLLSENSVSRLRMRLVKKAGQLAVSQFAERVTIAGRSEVRVAPQRLHAELEAGASINMKSVDSVHQPVASMVQQFEAWLGTSVHTNLYASWTEVQGFGTHRDDHDVFVLQLEGAKRWRIFEPARLTRDGSARGDRRWLGAEPTVEPTDDIVLKPGDLLYLPRQWWHSVQADQGTPSLHITIGLVHRTGVDLVRWIADQLSGRPEVHRDLPINATLPEKESHLRAIRDQVSSMLADTEILDRYVQAIDMRDHGHLRTSLPYVTVSEYGSAQKVRLTTGLSRLDVSDDRVFFMAAGKQWAYERQSEDVLRRLMTGVEVTLAELTEMGGMCAQGVRDLVGDLVKGQVAAVW